MTIDRSTVSTRNSTRGILKKSQSTPTISTTEDITTRQLNTIEEDHANSSQQQTGTSTGTSTGTPPGTSTGTSTGTSIIEEVSATPSNTNHP
jgi:hypothetical protein